MDNEELIHTLRLALSGTVPLVPFAPVIPAQRALGEGQDVILSAPREPFHVQLTEPVEKKRLSLNAPATKRVYRDLNKALTRLSDPGPQHPKLRTHRSANLDGHFGERIYQSYVQDGVPNAWRMWWFYDLDKERTITVAVIAPHPNSTTAVPRN